MKFFYKALVLIGLASISQMVSASAQMQPIEQELMLTASSVKVSKTPDPNTARITIKPEGQVLMEVSPNMFSRMIPLKMLTNAVWNGIFEMKAIPAALTWMPKNSPEKGVILSVTLESINEKSGVFTFSATVNNAVSGMLADKVVYVGNPIPYGTIKNAALTLDDPMGLVMTEDAGGASKIATAALASDSNPSSRLSMKVLKPRPSGTGVKGCVFQPYTDCRGIDLSNRDLSNLDLDHAILQNTTLKGANLSGTNLTAANMDRCQMANANLSNATLRSASLYACGIQYVTMSNANLDYANLSQANLDNANLSSSSMIGSAMFNVTAQYTNLNYVNMTNGNVCYAFLPSATFVGSTLKGTVGCYSTFPVLDNGVYGCNGGYICPAKPTTNPSDG